MRISPSDPLAARAKPAVIRAYRGDREGSDFVKLGDFNEWAKDQLPRSSLTKMLDEASSGDAPSVGNSRENRHERAKRVERQRNAMRRRAKDWLEESGFGPVVRVTMTRVAPRSLDKHDNLPASLKAHADGIAKALRLDDASPLIEWKYAQRKGPAAVEFTIEKLP